MNTEKVFNANMDLNMTSKRVKVPCINSANFVAHNKIVFDIPKELDYISLKGCYLQFDILINNSQGSMYLGEGGGSRLIRNLRIYEKSTGKNLENIGSYNLLNNVVNAYVDTCGETDKKSILEAGLTESERPANAIMCNPFTTPYNFTNAEQTDPKQTNKVRVLLKLNSGLFNNDVVFPNELCQLSVEILLETNKRALQVIPALNSTDKSYTARTSGAIANAANIDHFNISNNLNKGLQANYNQMRGHPVSKGSTITLESSANPANTQSFLITGCQVDTTTNPHTYRCNFGQVAAQHAFPASSYVYITDANLATASYSITSPFLEIDHINTPPQWRSQLYNLIDNDSFKYNFNCYENVATSANSGGSSYVFYINNNSLRAKACLTIPNSQLADTFSNDLVKGDYNANGYLDYSYYYNGANNPQQNVPLDKIQNNKYQQQHFEEVIRCFDCMDMDVKNLMKYKSQFCIARGFSIRNACIQLLNRDLSLRVNVPSGQTLAQNTLFNNYLMVVRQISLSKEGVEIVE